MCLLLGLVLGNSSRNTHLKLSALAENFSCLIHRGHLFRPGLLRARCFAKSGEVVLSTPLALARGSEDFLIRDATVDVLEARKPTGRCVLLDTSSRQRLGFVSK